MNIIIHSKHYLVPEFIYVSNQILKEWFGLDVTILPSKSDFIELSFQGLPNKICLPDTFFQNFEFNKNFSQLFISKEKFELPQKLQDRLEIKTIPVFFKTPALNIEDPNVTICPIDIFGISFFLLSRFEEFHSEIYDNHGRFLGKNSLMNRLGCPELPIVDILAEILWYFIESLSPDVPRKKSFFQKKISCDVDSPFLFHSSFFNLLKRAGGDLIYRNSIQSCFLTLSGLNKMTRNYQRDPYRAAISFIIKENNRHNNEVQFNFIPLVTDEKYDGPDKFFSDEIKELISFIKSEGHSLGIHPGYETYKNEELLKSSVEAFSIYSKDKIKGRQHYLRWKTGSTELLYEAAGISSDSSLGNADIGGFRCGTCRAFKIFSISERRCLNLIEEPLLIMENTYFSSKYLNFGVTEKSLKAMLRIKSWCKRLDGDFNLLWHNTSLLTDGEKEIYSQIIQ